MEAIWKSFKYLALKLEMLGRHKRQRTNSRSECQKTNCDLLYFSYLLLFFVSCLCVCSLFLLLPSLCVLFISDKSTSRASGKCKLRTFPPPFLSLNLLLSLSLSPVSHSIDYRLGHLLMKSMWQCWSKKKREKSFEMRLQICRANLLVQIFLACSSNCIGLSSGPSSPPRPPPPTWN